MKSYVTVKGQIVIPSRIRRKFGIKEGTRVQVDVDERAHRIILTPVTRDYIQNLRGKYKGKGLLTALAAEKKHGQKRLVDLMGKLEWDKSFDYKAERSRR